MNTKPILRDLIFLSLFTIFITFQPYLFEHEIIMMEAGVHLPGINALFHGKVLFRDFLYWHGPLEFYVPALMMKVVGMNSSVLPVFYYTFSVLTLVAAISIAYEIFSSRFIFYAFSLAMVAKTFPRIAFYYWGGLRYFMGFVALYFLVKAMKTAKPHWLFWGGMASVLSLLTTSESGFASITTSIVTLGLSFYFGIINVEWFKKGLFNYIGGALLIGLPYLIYLISTNSLLPYIDSTINIAFGYTRTMVDAPGNHPESFIEFIFSLIPGTKYFKLMTPVYCYLAILFLLIYRLKQAQTKKSWENSGLIAIGTYSLILYLTAFRAIWGHHLDMALQPEKILYFFIAQEIYFKLRAVALSKKTIFKHAATAFISIVLIVSVLNAVNRYNHRFVVLKWIKAKLAIGNFSALGGSASGGKNRDLSLLAGQEKRALNIPRAEGMIVPLWQAEEIEGVVDFLQRNTKSDEATFFYPELGNFAFWADRPFVGHFPIAPFSWIKEEWHEAVVADFLKANPRYVVMTKVGDKKFPSEWYFRNPRNKERFEEVTQLILDRYEPVKEFTSTVILTRKNK